MKNRALSVFFEVINSSATSTKFISNFKVFNNIKVTLYYSAYMLTSGEKVCISDEAELVPSVSYSHIRSFSGLYTAMCGNASEALTLGPLFKGPPSRYFVCKYSPLLVKRLLSALIIFSEPHLNSLLCVQRGPQEQLLCVNRLLCFERASQQL